MKNIVLIGMPGSGKSAIGAKLAKKLGMDFADTDDMIELSEGKSIKLIFGEDGEGYFRDCESRAAAAAAALENTVIATGGGLVLREENVAALKRTGIFVFIDRPVESILADTDMSGRPLLAQDSRRIYDLYNGRIGLYIKYADIEIKSCGDIGKNADDIAAAVKKFQSDYKGGGL